MLIKFIAIAAALSISAGAAAQPLKSGHQVSTSAAKARHAVLDNIISRVQMDALIKQVVAHNTVPAKGTDYADAAGNTARARS